MNMNKKFKKTLNVIPSMGIAFVVLGVVILTASFFMNVKSNTILFAGLFFVIAGTAGYIYSLKKG